MSGAYVKIKLYNTRWRSFVVREPALISESAAALVTEVVANTATAAAALATALALAVTLRALTSEMGAAAIEAALAALTLAASFAATLRAIAGEVIPTTIEALDWALAFATTLLATTLGAIACDVVATASEAPLACCHPA